MSERSNTADELEIRGLVARYADAVCRRDHDDWLATWHDDGVWDLFGRPIEGRQAMAATLKGALESLRFVVQVPHGGVVELDGDRADGRWTMVEWSDSDALGRLMMIFLYHDEYRRDDAGWRFASRRMQLLYQGPPDLGGKAFPPAALEGPS